MKIAIEHVSIRDALMLCKKFYSIPGNECGGSLHIVLDDGNLEDDHVLFCVRYAQENDDPLGFLVAKVLLALSEPDREKLYKKF